MKKLFIAGLAIMSFATHQVANAQTSSLTFTGSDAITDTVTDAGTVYLTSNDLTGKDFDTYRIQCPFTNISGTSTFKVILQGTIDGTNWTNAHQVEGTNGINCDTLQVTALSPSNWVFNARTGSVKSLTSSTFIYTNVGGFNKLRLKVIGTGTQVTKIGPAKGRASKSN